MKKYLITCLAVLLVGCASAPLFDPVEYNHYTTLYSTLVEHKQYCDTPEYTKHNSIPRLKKQTDYLVTYTGHKQNNNESKKMAAELNNFITEMELRYVFKAEQPSVTYCKTKFDAMIIGAERVMTAIGKENQK